MENMKGGNFFERRVRKYGIGIKKYCKNKAC